MMMRWPFTAMRAWAPAAMALDWMLACGDIELWEWSFGHDPGVAGKLAVEPPLPQEGRGYGVLCVMLGMPAGGVFPNPAFLLQAGGHRRLMTVV
ncbi:hypothetical protein D4A39_05855 [Alcanivorax profundi]|uniref:Uncharacterized protein n=1 Tax=Alcanivorax profundi TaxID=2338368 RepID=A0A418XYB3_9GAMM|nr:hypothetical protein D4A39_05855 [Alcanivorax profundi]